MGRFTSQEIAEEAARLRAFHNIRTPDSIQMATAIFGVLHSFLRMILIYIFAKSKNIGARGPEKGI